MHSSPFSGDRLASPVKLRFERPLWKVEVDSLGQWCLKLQNSSKDMSVLRERPGKDMTDQRAAD